MKSRNQRRRGSYTRLSLPLSRSAKLPRTTKPFFFTCGTQTIIICVCVCGDYKKRVYAYLQGQGLPDLPHMRVECTGPGWEGGVRTRPPLTLQLARTTCPHQHQYTKPSFLGCVGLETHPCKDSSATPHWNRMFSQRVLHVHITRHATRVTLETRHTSTTETPACRVALAGN